MFDDFADYLTEVTKYYHDSLGITFDHLEPFNEPYSTWWTANKVNGQEGCYFSQPLPSAGNASNTEALTFIINIAFEDYDVFEGVTEASFNPADNLYLNEVTVGKAVAKESYLSVLAKTEISEKTAKTITRTIGAGLGFRSIL